MIGIFEGLTNGYAQGLFLFDNMPSHQKCAPNALSARLMVKGVLCFILLICYAYSPRPLAPKKGWTHGNSGVRMRNGTLPDG
jgi:hypothetical protein